MKKILKKLFSYQEFENDKELLKIRIDTEAKYDSAPLSDEALGFAYGGTNTNLQTGMIVSFKIGNEIKSGKILEINGSQVNIEGFGLININQINQ